MMQRQLSRVQPLGPAQAYKTYQVSVPQKHMRAATCDEVECPNWLNGFKVAVPVGESRQAYLIKTSGKPYTVQDDGDGTRWAVFAAGTHCFAEPTHRIATGPELYVVKGGDWRGNPTGMRRVHSKPEHWVEDFALHQDKLITEHKKG